MTRFTVGWLYPDLMNMYGDRGNILTLVRRAAWRGADARVVELLKGPVPDLGDIDVFFFGGGQDREQALVYADLLEHKAVPLTAAIAAGATILAVCGGYQLLGRYYQAAEGTRYPGIGLIDAYTEAGLTRSIGDVVVDATGLGIQPATIVGFENHSGRTFLGPSARPLGRVVRGGGNNGLDGSE
ncbi:MAG: type 1 glutamine amidotransferase, partial [Candidatus Dormibacterales bacterium]